MKCVPKSILVAELLVLSPIWCLQAQAADSGLSYGLAGDGQADDTAALQHALSANLAITLPAGRFRITRPLVVAANGGILGPGTLLVDFESGLPDASNAAVLCRGDNIRIDGIKIEKRFVDGSYGIGILVPGGGYSNIRIHAVDISGYSARYGIHLVECEDFEISNCHIHDFMVDTAADMIADSPAGIRITRSRWGVISNNRILRIEVGPKGLESISPLVPSYGKQGYQSDHMTLMSCRNVTITGNTLVTSGEGIDMLLSQECVIAGNTIRDIWFQGIKMLGVSFATISGNLIRDCHQGIGLADHPRFRGDCNGNAITGNTILDSGSPGSFSLPFSKWHVKYRVPAGIDINGTSDYNVITGNVIMDTQTSKTMEVAINRNEQPHNILADNLQDSAYTRPPRPPQKDPWPD